MDRPSTATGSATERYCRHQAKLGAFATTDLERQLKERGVTQVVVTGVVTSGGVEATARHAYEQGFNVTLAQADRILTETEGPGGGFLDNGSSFGVYSRLNLYATAGRATALTSGYDSAALPEQGSAAHR